MDDPFDPWPDVRKVGTFASRAKAIWAHPVISWAIILGTVICCIRFWFWPPLPGFAVTVLGAAAAIMAFRKMHNTHKLLATFAIVALMGIELRDIRLDRGTSNATQAIARAASEANFKTIGDGITSAITQSQNQFSATVSHVDRVSGLAEENLKNMTGGDSWGWVDIERYSGTEDTVGLDINNAGKRYPLRGIRVITMEEVGQSYIAHPADIPDVPANGSGFVAPHAADLHPSMTSHNHYWIIISATNGAVMEDLWLDYIKGGGWSEKIEVYRSLANGKRQILKRLP